MFKQFGRIFLMLFPFISASAMADMPCAVKKPVRATHYVGICDNGVANGYGTAFFPPNISYSGNFNNGILHGVTLKSIEVSPGKFEKQTVYYLDGKMASERDWVKYTEQQDKICNATKAKSASDQEQDPNKALCDQYEERKRGERKQVALFQREASKPKCKTIKFTGYATIYPQHLMQLYQAQDVDEILADNPIVCTDSKWGGRYTASGAVINQNSMTECRGVGFFRNQVAEIIDWKDDVYWVSSNVRFNTGRRPIRLFVRKSDARCIN